MAIFQNARHERFAQNLAKGMSATEAYEKAGYKRNDGSAGRLHRNAQVKARVAELQGSTAKQITDIRDLARRYTVEAIELQVEIMRDTTAPASVRLAASLALHDRGHGKAVQHIAAEIGVYDRLSLDDKLALAAAIESLIGGAGADPDGSAPTHH